MKYPLVGLTCIGTAGTRIYQFYQVQTAPIVFDATSSQTNTTFIKTNAYYTNDTYLPTVAVPAANFSYNAIQQNYSLSIYDAYNSTTFKAGDAVQININLTAALTGVSYITPYYRVITTDDVQNGKLRFSDNVTVSTNITTAIQNLWLSGFFYVQAIIIRNIDANFSYELPNIMANTITRYYNNTGF